MSGIIPKREDLIFPFESTFNKLIDDFIGKEGSLFDSIKARGSYPKLDIITDQGKWMVEVAVPGLEAEDISVEIIPDEDDQSKSILKISGHKSESKYTDDAQWPVRELRRSAFERSLVLPSYIEGEPEASLQNGLLKLSWNAPKLKAPEKKKIAIDKK